MINIKVGTPPAERFIYLKIHTDFNEDYGSVVVVNSQCQFELK